MKKQSIGDRQKRLEECRCPIHGLALSQVSPYFQQSGGRFDGTEVCLAACSRSDCSIRVVATGPGEPVELLPEWEHLLKLQATGSVFDGT